MAVPDDPARVVRNSPVAEHVTLIRWQQRPGQLAAYRHFIDIFAPGFEWAAFLGVNEFLLPLAGGTVLGALDFLDQAGAVLVHRRVFSPGPWPEPPPGLAIETYDRRAADYFAPNRHIRVIARCSELLDVTQTAHEFRVNGLVFDTAGRLAPNAAVQESPCYRNLVVNHYCTGPRQDWLARIEQDGAAAGEILAELSQVQDDAIRAFAPAVRDLLGLAPPQGAVPEEVVSAGVSSVSPTEPAPLVVPERAINAGAPAVSPSEQTPLVVAAEAASTGELTVSPTEPLPVSAPVDVPVSQLAMPVPGAVPVPMEAASSGPPPPMTIVAVPAQVAPGWIPRGQDAQERVGGTALVFRDRSRAGDHWLAALRGAAAAGIDPAFLMDEYRSNPRVSRCRRGMCGVRCHAGSGAEKLTVAKAP